jgi:hypothetical protein
MRFCIKDNTRRWRHNKCCLPRPIITDNSSWTAWPLKTGKVCCPEMSVTIYQPTLRNVPEKRRPQSHTSLNPNDLNSFKNVFKNYSTYWIKTYTHWESFKNCRATWETSDAWLTPTMIAVFVTLAASWWSDRPNWAHVPWHRNMAVLLKRFHMLFITPRFKWRTPHSR